MSFRYITSDVIDGLSGLPSESVNCCITSPPYFGLRDYGVDGQIGLEESPEKYVERLVEVFREVRRVLSNDGTLWLNLGDTYASNWPRNRRNVIGTGSQENGRRENRPPRMGIGLKDKDLIGIPWRLAFALQADGWYLRSEIIWHKPNPMPESVTDRPTKSHEQVFLLAKSERYYYDSDSIREPFATDPSENYPARAYITGRGDQDTAAVRGNDRGKSGGFPPASHKGSSFSKGKTGISGLGRVSESDREDNPIGRNKRSVWTIPTKPYPGAHFATFPEDLIKPCVLAGCPKGGTVLDPFAGSATAGVVSLRNQRKFIGIDLNPEYAVLARERISSVSVVEESTIKTELLATPLYSQDLFDLMEGVQ